MIKRRKKIIKTKRKNPYLANVGYHVTDSYNLEPILQKGFVRAKNKSLTYEPLHIISYYFFEGYRPVYFLDLPNLKKLSESMRFHLEGRDLLLKVDVSKYDLQPDYNMLVINYNFYVSNEEYYDCIKKSNSLESLKYYCLSIDKNSLNQKKYENIKNIYLKYGEYDREYDTYSLRFDMIKNNDEIKEELIFFTETFCVNEDIPPSKILEFYEIEK